MSLANFNPANKSTLSGVLQEVLKNFSLELENCLPAVVKSYDRTNNIVTVQPAINTILTNGNSQPRDLLRLPVYIYGGGGLFMSFPLQENDTGWIIAGDRDISIFKQSLKVSNPNTYRTHQFSFGFFIPDKIKGYTINQADTNSFIISSLDGNTKITLMQNKIDIISGLDINIQSASNLTINASNIKIEGNITHTGNLTTSGTITANIDVIAGGISGKTHIHGGVTSGDKNTGVPQ